MNFWNLIVESNTFNFAILLLIFAIVIVKVNLPKLIDDLKENVASSINNARIEKLNCEKELKSAKKIAKNTETEVQQKLDYAKATAKSMADAIKDNTDIQINRIAENVVKVINAEEKKISSMLAVNTLEKSVDLASHKIKDMLNQNPSLHEKFILSCIEELEKSAL